MLYLKKKKVVSQGAIICRRCHVLAEKQARTEGGWLPV